VPFSRRLGFPVRSSRSSAQKPSDPLPGQGAGPIPLPISPPDDQATAVDDDGVGMAGDLVLRRHAAIVIRQQRKGKPGSFVEALHCFDVLLDKNLQDSQLLMTELSLELLLSGKLPLAVRSPRGAEAQEDNPSAIIFEPADLSGSVRQGKVGGLPPSLRRQDPQGLRIVLSGPHRGVESHDPAAHADRQHCRYKESSSLHHGFLSLFAPPGPGFIACLFIRRTSRPGPPTLRFDPPTAE